MERRNRSLEALNRLKYIDTLDDSEKALGLNSWAKNYLNNTGEIDLELELVEFKELHELFYKNIIFLKNYNDNTQKELSKMRKMRRFLQNS